MLPRVALVTQDIRMDGGLFTATNFLYRVLLESGRYRPEIISLATSASDSASVRLRSPKTWGRGIQKRPAEHRNLNYTHVGAWMSEFEFQRYRPRQALTDILREYDLIQFIVGSAAWAWAARGGERPVLVWTASTLWADRASRLRRASVKRRAWTFLLSPLLQQYERRVLRTAQVVFALSNYTFGATRPFVTPGNLVLAPCGIDTDFFRPAAPAARGYILSVARFSDARKNVELLLKAYAQLYHRTQQIPDLYLVGEPPSPSAQALLVKLGIAEKVRLLGAQPDDGLAELYRNARFFVLSSDEEGLGIVVLEAMASGLPVVSTACGGPETAVVDGETGFLTPVGDAISLATAMRKLLDNPALCQQMGRAGRRLAEEKFSLPVTGKVFLDKYDELLASDRRRPFG